MSSTKKSPIKFRLAGIKTDEFAIIEEALNEQDTATGYSLNTEFGILSHEKIFCSVSFKFLQKTIPFIKIKVSCIFDIEKYSWNSLIDPENSKIIFPKDFMDHVVVLTLGTLRGVLHAKTEGLKFNHFFVPTINVAELSKNVENLSFSIQISDNQK